MKYDSICHGHDRDIDNCPDCTLNRIESLENSSWSDFLLGDFLFGFVLGLFVGHLMIIFYF